MTGESATTTYSIPEPVEGAMTLIRTALARAGLNVLGELDISGRIQRSHGIEMAPCRVLYVCSRLSNLEGGHACPAVGIWLPLHIVVSARGEQTEIHLLTSLPPGSDHAASGLASPVNRLQSEISRAIEKIAMHRSYCQLTP
jgi:uncharacterized protein (DUF302 family)